MKAILLIRVSTEAQDLVQQREQVVDAAKRDGYDELILIEDKESAVKLSEEERNGLNRLKDTIESDSSIKAVYAYEISRISRRPDVVFSIRNFLIDHHIQLIILNPYFKMLKDDGTLSETSNIFFGIFSSMAENEGYIRKARLRRGVEKKKELGMHAGGQIMFGYSTVKTENGHKYVIKQAEATVVKRIFNEYVNGGKSMRMLTRDLQEEGVFKDVKFLTAVQEVYDILHREHYCGRVKGRPAIISEALFDKAEKKRKHSMLNINHTDNMSLLKGILRDGNTGLLLSSNTAAKCYYSKRQSGVSVGMHIIEPVMWEYAVQLHKYYMQLSTEEALKALERKIQYNMRKQYTINQKLHDIQKQRDNIEERLIKGRLSEQKADQMHEDLDKEEKEYKNRFRELTAEYDEIYGRGDAIVRNNEVNIDYNTEDKKERYDIVHSVIDKAILTRESRYILNVEVYNKMNDDIKNIKIDTYKKKIL